MIIIGVSGVYGSGKSTFTKAFKEEYWKQWLHFGDIYKDYKALYEEQFALPLKDFCIDVLGLTEEQCRGKDKNTTTLYRWQDIVPYVLFANKYRNTAENTKYYDNYMSARQVMQYYGEDYFRGIDKDLFVKRLQERIKPLGEYQKLCVIIVDDMRYENEHSICDFTIRMQGENGEKKQQGETVLSKVKHDLELDKTKQTPQQMVQLAMDKLTDRFRDYFFNNGETVNVAIN